MFIFGCINLCVCTWNTKTNTHITRLLLLSTYNCHLYITLLAQNTHSQIHKIKPSTKSGPSIPLSTLVRVLCVWCMFVRVWALFWRRPSSLTRSSTTRLRRSPTRAPVRCAWMATALPMRQPPAHKRICCRATARRMAMVTPTAATAATITITGSYIRHRPESDSIITSWTRVCQRWRSAPTAPGIDRLGMWIDWEVEVVVCNAAS